MRLGAHRQATAPQRTALPSLKAAWEQRVRFSGTCGCCIIDTPYMAHCHAARRAAVSGHSYKRCNGFGLLLDLRRRRCGVCT